MSFTGFTLQDLLDQGTTYGELADMLRADLQLDASTDLQPGTVIAALIPGTNYKAADVGTFIMPFSGGAGPVSVIVTHTLDVVPALVLATYSSSASVGLFVYEDGLTTTQITLRGVATAVAPDQSGYWLAIG